MHMGVAAIDMALYDMVSCAAGVPGWKWLGGARDRVRDYAMGGWDMADLGEYAQACEEALSEGFLDIKVKVGLGSLQEDLERIRVVKKLVGDGRVMVDANQAFTTKEALSRGRAYQDEGISW
jgi:L-alanine-DL-glutamate epimerase-like enolase superfamily enzyme